LRPRLTHVLALSVAVLSAGCGGDGGGDAREVPPPPPASTEAPATTEPPAQEGPLRLETVARGLDAPTHVAAAPGEPDRLYVVERPGRIRVVEGGAVRAEPFLDLTDRVRSGGEQGLLSVAFHPDYAENGLLYVDYTNLDGDTRVVELRARDDRSRAEPEPVRELLAVDQPFSNHNGGQLAFGPDGLLYVGMGDGGSGGDPGEVAQSLGSPLGKLLRIDVDAEGAEWETAAYGLRNPWRFSFDREAGALALADVGQGTLEEVNYLDWPAEELVNFGWDAFEGTRRFEDDPPNDAGRLVGPVHVYGRDEGCSVTGGFVYRGAVLPRARGRLFFGDYCSGAVWSFVPQGGEARDLRREPFQVEELSSFGEDAHGELLLVSLGGTVYRLVV
jgi:glucose/arabinose dehydrogenase